MMGILAHKDGAPLVIGLLLAKGALCPECGHATRVTSKRWAKCKQCGARVERKTWDEVTAKGGAE